MQEHKDTRIYTGGHQIDVIPYVLFGGLYCVSCSCMLGARLVGLRLVLLI
jgi:hypothetical protein